MTARPHSVVEVVWSSRGRGAALQFRLHLGFRYLDAQTCELLPSFPTGFPVRLNADIANLDAPPPIWEEEAAWNVPSITE